MGRSERKPVQDRDQKRKAYPVSMSRGVAAVPLCCGSELGPSLVVVRIRKIGLKSSARC